MNILVAEKLLNRSNVIPGLKKMRGERMPECMACHAFRNSCLVRGSFHGTGERARMHVPSLPAPGGLVSDAPVRWEQKLPAEFPRSGRSLVLDRGRNHDPPAVALQILPVSPTDTFDLGGDGLAQAVGSIVVRSLLPFPARTTTCPRSRSASITRNVQHSTSRSPEL